jgi:hypothetical protein
MLPPALRAEMTGTSAAPPQIGSAMSPLLAWDECRPLSNSSTMC